MGFNSGFKGLKAYGKEERRVHGTDEKSEVKTIRRFFMLNVPLWCKHQIMKRGHHSSQFRFIVILTLFNITYFGLFYKAIIRPYQILK